MKPPEVKNIDPVELVGDHLIMSLSNNRTQELWQRFAPRIHEIKNGIDQELYAIQIYDELKDFREFHPGIKYTTWAAKAVSDLSNVPEGMSSLTLEGGLYAVFIHKGLPSDFPKTMAYILGEWMPSSGYHIDHRPHFQVMGEKYKNNDPSSEEDVWIPIKPA